MKSIRDIIQKFSLRLPPEKNISKTIEAFLEEKKVPKQKIEVALHKQNVFVKGDPYIKIFIKVNQQELISYIKEKIPQYKINKID